MSNKQTNEPTIETHPASAWVWFLAAVLYLATVALIVIPFMLEPNAARDAAIHALRIQLGEIYGGAVIVLMLIVTAPVAWALNKAGAISYRYKNARGIAPEKSHIAERKISAVKVGIIAGVIVCMGLYIANNPPR